LVLEAGAFDLEFKDYSTHILNGTAKEGQKLEEVKDLLLKQIEKIKAGDFPDWLLSAIITDMKLQQTKMYESNSARADAFVSAFITHTKWDYSVNTINRLSKITKQQIIDFVKANYNNNYVVVYKRTGEDKSVQKVVKPEITPVEVNRNDQSDFVKSIINTPSKEIEPVFIDYASIKKTQVKNNITMLYNENTENKTFDMYYVFDMGTNHNKTLGLAIEYLKYLGTKKQTAAAIQQEFYQLGCSFDVFSSEEQTWVSLRGLSENFAAATKLFEELLANAEPNEEAYKSLVGDILKKREDAKLNKGEILFGALANYSKYGKTSPYTHICSKEELSKITGQELVNEIKKLNSYEHRILFYGSNSMDEISKTLTTLHQSPAVLKPITASAKFVELENNNEVYVVDYDMKQAEIIIRSKDGAYDKNNVPTIRLFNEYFGGGMSSIVFQEIRESKALAYSVWSGYLTPSDKLKSNYIHAYVGTQADKLPEAMAGIFELINNMPEAENNFKAAKESIIQGIRTERITKANILFNYENAKKLGLDSDIRKAVYEKVPNMTFAEIKAFEEQHYKSKKFTIVVLGKKENLDLKTLEKYGKVSFLTLEEIFGY
jgi:predicted Zn-dependent peptidase